MTTCKIEPYEFKYSQSVNRRNPAEPITDGDPVLHIFEANVHPRMVLCICNKKPILYTITFDDIDEEEE